MTRSVTEHQSAVARLLSGGGYAGRGHDAGAELLPLTAALGRVLAADVHAPIALPPFDNSQMDGYAVHRSDLADGAAADGAEPGFPLRLRVGAPVPAGTSPPPLPPGTAVPIMTGAMVPQGTGAIVPIERADPPRFLPAEAGSGAPAVHLPAGTPAGSFIRRAGSDIAAGERALPAGTLLGPAQLGLLAACGLAEVAVRTPFRVLLLSTGDEVTEPGLPLADGRIYDANTTLLEAALREAGADVLRHRVVSDDPQRLREALEARPAAEVHLILTSGGISQGAYEVVKQALAGSGVEFPTVALQPGGPQAIGTLGGVPFLGFPGNPVSALVSFEMFLRPALTALTGAPAPRVQLRARLAAPASSPAGKHQVRRGRYRDGQVELVGGPGSHLLSALAGSNALVHFPVGLQEAAAGDEVTLWLIDAVLPPAPSATTDQEPPP
ncbi:molybdopterin molybdotransferase MoeA [Arthrobacter sp. TMN-37]